MNASVEYQIDLLEKLIRELDFFSSQVTETTQRYRKYIQVLENNGLFTNAVSRLTDEYYVNTKARLNEIVEQVQNKDIPDAKELISRLENIKAAMEQ